MSLACSPGPTGSRPRRPRPPRAAQIERVTCKVHLQHLRMATPPEMLSWLVSLLVKGVTARGGDGDAWHRSGQLALAPEPAWPHQTHTVAQAHAQGPHGLSHCAPKDRVAKPASKGLRELCASVRPTAAAPTGPAGWGRKSPVTLLQPGLRGGAASAP